MAHSALCGIYQIKNKVNEHRYIGSSVNIQRRWKQHKSRLSLGIHHNAILQGAWNKYGEDNLEFKILLLCKRDDTLKYEQAFLDKITPHYNIAENVSAPMLGKTHTKKTREKLSKMMTGEGNHRYGKKCSKETKRKMSKSHKGQVQWNAGQHLSKEHKKKVSDALMGIPKSEKAKQNMRESWKTRVHYNKGKHLSDEHKKNISESLKGYQKTEEHRRKLSENHADVSGENHPMYGKRHSEETKRKMSAAQSGKKLSQEHRKKLSKAHFGKKHSEETKRKMSEARKLYLANKKAGK